MMMTRQQSDAVRTDERTAVLLANLQNAFLQDGTGLCLLTEACTDDDESLCLFLLSQQFNGVRAHLRRNH